jgi:hypothetical protein
MFLRYFVELPLPASDVERVLLGSPERWIPDLADEADDAGRTLLAEVGFGPRGLRVGKGVHVEVEPSLARGGAVVLPIRWRATGPEGLFPSMDADIEVAGLGASRTQLSFSGRYRPPMGRLGEVADRAVLHRVSEAVVKDFVDRLADRIRAEAGPIEAGSGRT